MSLFSFKSSTLFWSGCYTSKYNKKQTIRYKKILKKLGVGFTLIEDLFCCSGVYINAGYEKQARKLARENFEKLKSKGIKKIITSCPLCYKTFSKDYPELIPDWDIEVEYILTTIRNLLERDLGVIKQTFNQKPVVLYENPILTRYCEILEEPREILGLLEIKILELKNNKKNTRNIGTTGNLLQTNPEIANQLALEFIKNLPENTQEIITLDSQDHIHLKNNLTNPLVQVIDFSEIICQAFKIKIGLLS